MNNKVEDIKQRLAVIIEHLEDPSYEKKVFVDTYIDDVQELLSKIDKLKAELESELQKSQLKRRNKND